MRTSRFVTVVLLLGALNGALALAQPRQQPPIDTFTSVAALRAIANYDTGLRKLDEEYARRLEALRQQYVKELDVARKGALEREDLDEAQRLLEEKKRVAPESHQPGAGKGLEILSAVYGIGDTWMDVTPRVRSKISFSKFHYAPEEWRSLPDLAPGRHKTIIICYTMNGRVGVSTTQDDQAAFDLPKR
jgi:hypothetical protein